VVLGSVGAAAGVAGVFSRRMAKTALPVASAASIANGLQGTWLHLQDRLWSLWIRYACTAFYSHPFAWDEIGFTRPAYPRGYKNLGVDRLEPFEVRDVRPDADPTKGADFPEMTRGTGWPSAPPTPNSTRSADRCAANPQERTSHVKNFRTSRKEPLGGGGA